MRQWLPILLALGGMLTCLFLWLSLGDLARYVGTAWAAMGVLLWLLRRRYTVLPGAAA
jgi:putrescine importer